MLYLKDLLQKLNDTKLVKVTGSYADGTQHEGSDIDFYVKEDKPDSDKRNMQKIIEIIENAGLKWDSCICGHIATIGVFPMLEFSQVFDKRKNRLKTVLIEGVEFKTH